MISSNEESTTHGECADCANRRGQLATIRLISSGSRRSSARRPLPQFLPQQRAAAHATTICVSWGSMRRREFLPDTKEVADRVGSQVVATDWIAVPLQG